MKYYLEYKGLKHYIVYMNMKIILVKCIEKYFDDFLHFCLTGIWDFTYLDNWIYILTYSDTE
jgi:hypothetical protein